MTINKWNILPLLIALGLLIASFSNAAINSSWDQNLYELIFVFGGFMAFVFSDTFAEYTSHYGWTRDQILQNPVWYVKICGAILLLVYSNMILGII